MEWDEAERALWCAVILQAFLDVMRVAYDVHVEAREICRERALAWFFSEQVNRGSFKWICDALKLNSSYLLKGLQKRPTGRVRHFNQGVL